MIEPRARGSPSAPTNSLCPPEKARLVKHQDVPGSRLRFGFTVAVTFILGFGLSAMSFSLFNILFNGAPWPRFL